MQETRNERQFLDQVAKIIRPEAVEVTPEVRRFFATDALGQRGEPQETVLPLAVAKPGSANEVASLLALASEAKVAIIPYGAGTGLMGGARSGIRALVLDMSSLNDIQITTEDRVVWAGAGLALKELDAELNVEGLCLGHDPWTFPVATVDGAVSTNGLGFKGGLYGGIGDQVLGLEVALADGTLVRTKAVRRSSTGPDLARLFVGAEGTLGVITTAALRAFPQPERQELSAFQFPRFEDGLSAIAELNKLGLRPSLLDYGEEHASPWPDLTDRAEELPILYLGFEGLEEEVLVFVARAASVIRAQSGEALPQAVAQTFWDNRHVSAERFARTRTGEKPGRRNPGLAFDFLHVALPASKTLAFQQRCHVRAEEAGAAVIECGIWLGPELFSAAFAIPETLGGQKILNLMMDDLLREAQDLGGSMEYVHGVGSRLNHLMEREHGNSLELLHKLKAALDPQEILNPTKLGLKKTRRLADD